MRYFRRPRMQDATLIDDRFQMFAVKVDEHTIYGRRGLKENKIGFVSPARRYEAPTVVRPPQM